MSDKLLYTLKEAAAKVGYSEGTMRRAIKATDPGTFPPPLLAKQPDGRAYKIRAVDLEAWVDSLPDA